MNEIAKTIGFKLMTVYKYFKCKNDILKSIYEFYSTQPKLRAPDLNSLISTADIFDLRAILKELVFDSPPELEETMNRILAIAIHDIYRNNESLQFIQENLFGPTIKIYVPLLNRLIESGRIEPIDIDSFIDLFLGFDYYAVSLDHSSLRLGYERWVQGRELILSLLKPK